MSNHDSPRYRYERNKQSMQNCEAISENDKERIGEFVDAIDPENLTLQFRNEKGEMETKSTNTLRTYTFNLKRFAEVSPESLTEIEATEINKLISDLQTGNVDHTDVKSDGYSKSYLLPFQAALRGFYRYHDDLGVDPGEIVIYGTDKKGDIGDRDMYTKADVEAMRKAVENARDRCMLELFLNTGQRIRVIQTLRIKDVDPHEGATGVYYLNTNVEGLKNADKAGKKRPLLGAKRAVIDWLEYHPMSDDPEAFLITPRKDHPFGETGGQLGQSTIRRTLKKIADAAGVEKPPNPHNFRHYFVTTCKRHYNMDDSTIRFLVGHAESSTIMETTYSHLTDEDHIKDAEEGAGYVEPETESLTPPVCPTCYDPLEPSAKACGKCGTVFAPDSQAVKTQLEEDADEKKEEAETLDRYKVLDRLVDVVEEDPEVLDKLERVLAD